MTENPFSEPEDDRTIMRPKPGGQRSAAAGRMQPARPPPSRSAAASPVEPPPIFAIGANPLTATAEPLILLLARLWNAPAKPFSGDLRDSAIRALHVFEQRARDAGVPMEQLRPAHFALCSSIDDVVQNTPWGAAAGWDAGSLAATFHLETRGGERFLEQLAQICRKPASWLPVIELMYVCLSPGFMGPYRRSPGGAEAIERVRQQTHAVIIAQRPSIGPILSTHWAGVAAPYLPGRARFPVWVVGSVALAIIAGLFVWCMVALNAASDDVYARMLSAPPSAMPQIARSPLIRPPPPPPETTLPDRLAASLRSDIGDNRMAVLGTAGTAVLRVGASTMFVAGGATLAPNSVPLLERIGAALRNELSRDGGLGAIRVNAYTDNQPFRSVKFPSNFQLSASRAEAVREVLQRVIGSAPSIGAEGRADADPIDSNATPDGREHNRRMEIVLQRQP